MTADPREIIDSLDEIKVQKPAEVIIKQIEHLIVSGALKPGDRLPAERALSEKFGVGRGHVREALKRLEFSGIVKTLPQSGTYVADLNTAALEELVSGVLEAKKNNLDDLLETRLILEVNAARLAAERVATEDLIDLIRIHEAFRRQAKDRNADSIADQNFHRKIAECSKNSVLCSLITLIILLLLSAAVSGSEAAEVFQKPAVSAVQAFFQGNARLPAQ